MTAFSSRPLTERTQKLIDNNIIPSLRKTSSDQWILKDGSNGIANILHFSSASENFLNHLARAPSAPYSQKDHSIDKGDSLLYFGACLVSTSIAANAASKATQTYLEPERIETQAPLPDKLGAKKSCLEEFYDVHTSSFEVQELSTYLDQCVPEKLTVMTEAAKKAAIEEEAHSQMIAEGGLAITFSLITAWTFGKGSKKWRQSENRRDAAQAGRLIQQAAKQTLEERALSLE